MYKVGNEAGGIIVGLTEMVGNDMRGKVFYTILGNVDLAHDSFGLIAGFVTSSSETRVLDELQDEGGFAGA